MASPPMPSSATAAAGAQPVTSAVPTLTPDAMDARWGGLTGSRADRDPDSQTHHTPHTLPHRPDCAPRPSDCIPAADGTAARHHHRPRGGDAQRPHRVLGHRLGGWVLPRRQPSLWASLGSPVWCGQCLSHGDAPLQSRCRAGGPGHVHPDGLGRRMEHPQSAAPGDQWDPGFDRSQPLPGLGWDRRWRAGHVDPHRHPHPPGRAPSRSEYPLSDQPEPDGQLQCPALYLIG
jgi:hypothetical protein